MYSRVAKQLVKQQKYSEIQQLLKCVNESGVAAKNDGDNIILNCLNEFRNIPAEVILSCIVFLLKTKGYRPYRLQGSLVPVLLFQRVLQMLWLLAVGRAARWECMACLAQDALRGSHK